MIVSAVFTVIIGAIMILLTMDIINQYDYAYGIAMSSLGIILLFIVVWQIQRWFLGKVMEITMKKESLIELLSDTDIEWLYDNKKLALKPYYMRFDH